MSNLHRQIGDWQQQTMRAPLQIYVIHTSTSHRHCSTHLEIIICVKTLFRLLHLLFSVGVKMQVKMNEPCKTPANPLSHIFLSPIVLPCVWATSRTESPNLRRDWAYEKMLGLTDNFCKRKKTHLIVSVPTSSRARQIDSPIIVLLRWPTCISCD